MEFTERCLVIWILFLVYFCQYQSIATSNKKQLEEVEEANEAQHEQDLDKSNR